MSQINIHSKSLDHIGNKTLIGAFKTGAAQHSRNLQTSGNPELAAWYEDAHDYYNAVMNGREKRPSAVRWDEFLDQLNWAYEQMQGDSPAFSEIDSSPVEDTDGKVMESPALPPGALLGTLNNVTWSSMKVDLQFTGDARPQDIWSNEINLNVSSLSATVSAEKTIDTRMNPPQAVVKIIVEDQATGKGSVYFIHDYQDAHVKINTPAGKIDRDMTGGVVTAGTYQTEAPDEQEPVIQGAPQNEDSDISDTENDEAASEDFSDDTQLPKNKKKGDTWHYDGNDLEDVSVTPTFDHRDNVVEIPGVFTLTPSDDQTVEIRKDPDTQVYIITVKAEGKEPVTYHIDRHLSKIDLKIQESKLKFVDENGDEDPSLLVDDKISIKGKPVSQSNIAQASLHNQLSAGRTRIQESIFIGGKKYQAGGMNGLNKAWEEDVDWALRSADDIAAGMADDDWTALISDFGTIDVRNPADSANRAQMLLAILRSSLGGSSGNKKLKVVLARIFSSNPDLQAKWSGALANIGNYKGQTVCEIPFAGDWVKGSENESFQTSIDFIMSIKAELQN